MSYLRRPDRIREALGDIVASALSQAQQEGLPYTNVDMRTVTHCGGSVWVEVRNVGTFKIAVSEPLSDGAAAMTALGDRVAELRTEITEPPVTAQAAKPASPRSQPRLEMDARRSASGGCTALIWHGPGHQSATYCEQRGTHDVHACTYGSFQQPAEWRGDETHSGFFDEPPELDE